METEVEVTKMSSKGQIVLPKRIRAKLKIKEGTLFALKATGRVILLKRIDNPILKEDLEELEEARKAWSEIEAGNSHKLSKNAFLKELATW
jgi:AbrB family looped-hinge helix DNA binding protein